MKLTNMFCVTSLEQLGCTFLDWSIHYLSGQTEYFYTGIRKTEIKPIAWTKLSDNPVKSINAHGHPKNHPHGSDELNLEIKIIKDTNIPTKLYSSYPVPKDGFKGTIKENQYIIEDYIKIFDICKDNGIPLIFVTRYPIDYLMNLRNRDTYNKNPRDLNTIIDYQRQYFPENIKKWNEAAWDSREFLAVHIRPFENYLESLFSKTKYMHEMLSKDHYRVNANRLWFDGELVLISILQFLNLKLDTSRLAKWKDVYRNWQENVTIPYSRLSWDISLICQSIVNGYSLDLSSYKLDLYDEAIILHVLLYQYNLNIKSYGLESFPKNTKDLHMILEKNEMDLVYDHLDATKRLKID